MNKEFKWDESLIKEFLSENFFSYALSQTLEERLNKFKERKQPKPEWEIIEYIGMHSLKIYQRAPTGGWCSNDYLSSFDDESIKKSNSGCGIHSVKRLSDNTIWSFGNKFDANAGCQLTISKFSLTEDNRIIVHSKEYGYWFLEDIRRPALFTSQDGKPIYKDDKFYFVDKSFRINEYWADSCWTPVQDGLEFSTKDAAEDYVLHHKPTISLSQVLLRYSLIFGNNDEFAESMKNIAFKAIHNDTK